MKPLVKVVKKPPVVEVKNQFTDLRQVMDYNRNFSIFYSGVEYERHFDILYNLGVRNFLMSYIYAKGKGSHQLSRYDGIHLFIDSGAFTYMNNPEYESYTVEQWEKMIETYLVWARKHKDKIFAIAEMDLQYLVGEDIVDGWRKRYFEPFMLETGVPVCFIYHDEGMEKWEYMCKRYPYVGISLNVDGDVDEGELREKFRIAEKYNALVQGMASTKTQMLTEYPFYTVDSTTWNVGYRFGEISVWDNTRMKRVKRVDFETKGFPIIDQYDKEFNHDLILEDDREEMVRVNGYAFMLAEKYINERLKAKMYWLKARIQKVDLDNLPDDFFPTPEWFKGSMSDIGDYLKKMNISTEFEGVKDLLYDATVFLNWDNPEYSEMVDWYKAPEQLSIIDEIHDTYVNRIVTSNEEKIKDIITFFTECVSGENDKLLLLGTNFDRTVKERDSYIEDDLEEEIVDLSPEEIQVKLYGLLPSHTEADEGEEIACLNDEIFKKAGVIPTFDDKGKFVKGQMTVRKPKKVYSKKYPKFACDTCHAAQKCAEYKAGHVCAFQKMFERFDTRNMADIIQAMQGMSDFNLARMQKAMIEEVMTGTLDPNVTGLIDQNVRLMNQLKQMYETSSQETLRQTRTIRADGTQEQTTEIMNPQSGGILERLFGNMTAPVAQEDEEQESDVVVEKKVNDRYKDDED